VRGSGGEQGNTQNKRGFHGGINLCDTTASARFHPTDAPGALVS